jgi:hypothetical protein
LLRKGEDLNVRSPPRAVDHRLSIPLYGARVI